MENISELNAFSLEAQASNQLSVEELETIAGGWGWDEFKEGLRDVFAGAGDGFTGNERQEDNFNYLGGYIIGGAINAVIPG